MPQYLLRFITERKTASFRFAELDALLELHGVTGRPYDTDLISSLEDCPYLVVSLANDDLARAICEDAILLRDVMEIWGDGETHAACAQRVVEYDDARKVQYFDPKYTWSCGVEAYGFSLTFQEQHAVRLPYESAAPFEGKVQLKDPQLSFRVVERYQAPFEKMRPAAPVWTYFGRVVATTQRRHLVYEYDLKKRIFLGPTALDNELALLMASVSLCRRRSVVLDPFVGTGSILVACALVGAFCFGADIDWKVRGVVVQRCKAATLETANLFLQRGTFLKRFFLNGAF
ncbi:hypothetical protein M885DRAFT_174064 [Pelagophyceae sp. CCMP2097]|nr:hypothetical protein M885DRAFT_174064 [Pelagophyceae sp. CCMP2097]